MILRFLPAAKTAGFLLAMPLVFALVACGRPDGSNHPQVQSPFLLATAMPTSIVTVGIGDASDPGSLALPTSTPAPTATSVAEAQIAEAVSTGIQFFDTFDSSGRQPLNGRLPDVSPISAVWSAVPGQWQLRGTHVGPGFRAPETFIAIIEPGISSNTIEIEAARLSGELGIVFRYESEADWYAARHNGRALIIERLIAGTLTELSRGDSEWTESGRTRTLAVIDAGNRIDVSLDGVTVASAEAADSPPNSRIGILSRESADNQFHSISIFGNQ